MSRVDIKVVLLGKEYCGKTSLVDRYLNSRFCGSAKYQNTIGAAFGCKKVHFPSEGEHERLLQGRELVLGIWDTAGSERYESMSRIYYRGAAAAVVCYDVTDADSWERLGFWVRELRKFEENCRVYVCATKKDLLGGNNKRRAVDYHNTTDYAEEEGTSLFETSSKTGENVEELFLQIARDYLTDPKNRQSTADPAEDGGGDQKRNNIAIAKAPKTRKKSRSSTCCN